MLRLSFLGYFLVIPRMTIGGVYAPEDKFYLDAVSLESQDLEALASFSCTPTRPFPKWSRSLAVIVPKIKTRVVLPILLTLYLTTSDSLAQF